MNYPTLSHFLSFARQSVDFWHYFWRRFNESHCTHSAAALSYTTLLALVPLMAVSLAVFAAFPAYQEVSAKLQDFLFENLVPAARETIQAYFYTFAEKAKKLTGPGIISLIATALLLMATIEKSLNVIWGAQPYKAFLRRFLMYWSVLTLGPLLIGAGIAITSQFIAMPWFSEAAKPIVERSFWIKLLPFVLEAFAFALLFQIVPNAKVRVSYAAIGGIVSAILFELAKAGFAFYIARFPTYEAIYGALAAVPIFLVWLYVSWVVTLMGAQFTYCLHTFRYAGGEESAMDASHDLLLAYRVLRAIWCGQCENQLLTVEGLGKLMPKTPQSAIVKALSILKQNHWITEDQNGGWLLLRDPHLASLCELYLSHSYILPRVSNVDRELRKHLEPINKSINENFDVPLATLFSEALDAKQNSTIT
ncbi:MAG TPA: YihY family inner membrane protein [Methylothermaceae bacterium]|nr:YihY family inner membrane protein [Methylothermaceae bacterium]